MTCRTIDIGDGRLAIVCDRGRKRALCTACKQRPHTKLCDFPLAGDRAGKTCDVRLCDRCAVRMVRIGPDVDYCPPHARVWKPTEEATPARDDVGDVRREVLRNWVRGELERDVRAWCADRFVDEEDVIEFWTERAAIREHEGGTPKWAAEELAFADVRERFGP